MKLIFLQMLLFAAIFLSGITKVCRTFGPSRPFGGSLCTLWAVSWPAGGGALRSSAGALGAEKYK